MKRDAAASASTRLHALSFLLLGALALPALGQGVYRIVGPDGRVTFSDQPPAQDATTAAPAAGTSSNRGQVALPFALRQVATRFPVVLYTGSNCTPCDSGRAMLNARGIPYTEKTVTTANDGEALKRLSGDTTLPFLTIGGQQIKGYSDTEWTQFLNAAGYPQQSALPANYRRPAPSPLVTAQSAEPASAPVAQPGASAPASAPAAGGDNIPVTPQNPGGIRF